MSQKIFTDSLGNDYYRDKNIIRVFNGKNEIGQLTLGEIKPGKLSTIVDVGVNENFRNRGIGSTLTRLAEKVTAKEGASGIGLIGQPDYLQTLETQGYIIDGNFATKLFPRSSQLEGSQPDQTSRPTINRSTLLRIINKLGGGETKG